MPSMTDRLEIDDLLIRYASAVDTKDWDLYASCFTPDAFIDCTAAGVVTGQQPTAKQWLSEVMASFPMTQHVVCNRAVAPYGDTATSRSCFSPRYDNDELVRTAAGWRIAERVGETSSTTRLQRVATAGDLGL